MIIKSYEQRVKLINSKTDLMQQIQEARVIEQRANMQFKHGRPNRIHPMPNSELRILNPIGYRNLQKAREVSRLLSANFHQISASISAKQQLHG